MRREGNSLALAEAKCGEIGAGSATPARVPETPIKKSVTTR